MRLLDLFCGAGGAAMGYYLEGFTTIVGVDIEPQPSYPFEFIEGDALNVDYSKFDLIHASPPCQRFSSASGVSRRNELYIDQLRPTRKMLENSNIPYVIENVEYAPLINPLKLCGTLFPELKVLRHRLFECSFPIPQPYLWDLCSNHPKVYTYKDKGVIDPHSSYVTVAGGGNCPLKVGSKAMGIDWMTQRELSQAVPPAYTRYVGKFAKAYLQPR